MKKLILYALVLMSILPLSLSAQKKFSFEIKDGHFYRDGKVIPIISGEMHYPRIPHQYWRHRLKMLKAMGLNTVATYVFWNACPAFRCGFSISASRTRFRTNITFMSSCLSGAGAASI